MRAFAFVHREITRTGFPVIENEMTAWQEPRFRLSRAKNYCVKNLITVSA